MGNRAEERERSLSTTTNFYSAVASAIWIIALRSENSSCVVAGFAQVAHEEIVEKRADDRYRRDLPDILPGRCDRCPDNIRGQLESQASDQPMREARPGLPRLAVGC